MSASNALTKHQRTKSSPEQLGTTTISPSEASRRLIASESMNDLLPPRHIRHNDVDMNELPRITPPGTPPPPYPAPILGQDIFSSTLNDVNILLALNLYLAAVHYISLINLLNFSDLSL